MVAVGFINFLAMLTIAMIVVRFAEILGRKTWLAGALGAIFR